MSLYHVQLKIAFIGIAEDKVDLWKGIAPKERFHHSFYTIAQEEGLIRELADEEQLLIIMDKKVFCRRAWFVKRCRRMTAC